MPAPSLTEYGKLSSLGLITHYQRNQNWYIQQGRILVTNSKFAVSATKIATGSAHVFSQDEVAMMLRLWLMVNQQWQQIIAIKTEFAQQSVRCINGRHGTACCI
jgi:hypothetical protein